MQRTEVRRYLPKHRSPIRADSRPGFLLSYGDNSSLSCIRREDLNSNRSCIRKDKGTRRSRMQSDSV